MSAAKAEIAAAKKNPTWTKPGPAIDAKKIMAGKTIVGIPATSANPFSVGVLESIGNMGPKLGFKFIEWKNQGTTGEHVAGIEHAIAIHADLIDLSTGTDPRLLGPQIKKAQEAGIVVIETHETGLTQGKSPYVDFTFPAPYEAAGKLQGDYGAVTSEGDVDGLIITSEEVRGAPVQVEAIEAALEETCPDTCKTTIVNAPVAKWSSTVGPAVSGALLQDPNINYVFPLYDAEASFVVPALNTAHKSDSVKIVTYAGTPSTIDYVREGKVAMDVGENLSWIGLSILDDEIRLLGGLKPVFNEHLALKVFDEENAAEAGEPAELSTGYGDAIGNGYCELWGLPKADCS